MSNWPTHPLSDFIDPERSICYGIVQPGSAIDDGVPVVRVNNFRNGRLDTSDVLRVSMSIEEKYSRSRLRGGELLVSLVGTLGQTAIAPDTLRGWNVARAVGVIPLRSDVDKRWIHFVLRSKEAQEFIQIHANTTVQATFNLRDLAQLPVPLPPDDLRSHFTTLLSALDDKIELNRQLNNTLEAMALAIFKSWFIDFDPVRAKMAGRNTGLAPELAALFPDSLADSEFGEVPNGWSFSTIGAETEVVGGNTPSTKDSCFWDGTFAFATPKDLSGLDSPFLLNTERRLTKEGVERVSSGVLPVDTVLMSSRAPIGYVAIARIPVSINQGFAGIKCTRKIGPIFTYFWAKFSKTIIEGRASGSTFLEISKGTFREVEVLRPDETLLSAFEKVATPLFDRIESGVRESATLAALRDFLLPKLMSGEIRVEDAEKLAGEAGV